jgi:hypothetical protein
VPLASCQLKNKETEMSKKKENSKSKPKVNPKLEGFEMEIDKFGEIKTSFDIDKLNEFLDENVEDKKLINREDNEEEK